MKNDKSGSRKRLDSAWLAVASWDWKEGVREEHDSRTRRRRMALRNAVEVTAREIAREELRDQIGELRTVVSASKGAQAPEIQHLQRTIREAYEEADVAEALLREILADTERDDSPTCLEGDLYERVRAFTENEAVKIRPKPGGGVIIDVRHATPGPPEPELPEPVGYVPEETVNPPHAANVRHTPWRLSAQGRFTHPLYSESTVRSLVEQKGKAQSRSEAWATEADRLKERAERAERVAVDQAAECEELRRRIGDLEAERDAYADPGNWRCSINHTHALEYIGPTPSDSTEGGEAESKFLCECGHDVFRHGGADLGDPDEACRECDCVEWRAVPAPNEAESVEGEVGHSMLGRSGRFVPVPHDWPTGTRVKITRLPTDSEEDR